jgi:hypothetical protein
MNRWVDSGVGDGIAGHSKRFRSSLLVAGFACVGYVSFGRLQIG